ncbi:MAG: hypothetical protein WBH03_07910 [Cyclobacteriaceae bacterium]
MSFSTDVDTVKVPAEFDLTLQISANERHTVRFLKDYGNIFINTGVFIECQTGSSNYCRDTIGDHDHNVNWDQSITEFTIGEGRLITKTFKVKIDKVADKYEVIIPEKNYNASYPVAKFESGGVLTFTGRCIPINPNIIDSNEDFIEGKRIIITD